MPPQKLDFLVAYAQCWNQWIVSLCQECVKLRWDGLVDIDSQYQPTHPILVSHILGNIAGKEESYKPPSELLQEKCILHVHSL